MTDTQILKLVKIREIQLTARECLAHLRIYEKDSAEKIGIFLPDVNHHKLQLNEEKYSKCKILLYNSYDIGKLINIQKKCELY